MQNEFEVAAIIRKLIRAEIEAYDLRKMPPHLPPNTRDSFSTTLNANDVESELITALMRGNP